MADFQDYLQIFVICVLSTILVGSILWRKQNKHPHPPGPLALPIIGHFHLLALLSPLLHSAFHKLSIRYGPIILLFMGSVPCIVVSTAEAAKEFLKTHETSFSNRARTVATETYSYGLQGIIFTPYGDYWRFIKKLCMSELLGQNILNRFLAVRQQETKRFIKLVLNKGVEGEAVDFGEQFMKLANDIMSRMTISQTSSKNDDEANEMMKMVADITEILGEFNISEFIWFLKRFNLQGHNKRLKEVHDKFDTRLNRVIKEHEEERRKRKEMGGSGTHQSKDILDVLLDIYEAKSSEMKLTKENIKAFILDIFLAGTDTSALALEWAIAELINNPHVMKKARQEIDAVVGKSRMVEESDVMNLPYLQAIVKETLRLHPVVPMIFRESSRRDIVGGYDIPAKSKVFINIWAIGRDPNHWENPLEFRPERFIGEDNDQMDVRGQHYHLIPFGSGRRVCPGTSLALQVLHVNLGAVIQCFELKVEGGNGTIDMAEKPGMTMRRAQPLICVPLPRLNPFPSM